MKTLLSEKDAKIAIDIADTLTHFRRECGCFPTKELLKQAITEEVKLRPLDNKSYAAMMVQDILVANEEWFDKESEPE